MGEGDAAGAGANVFVDQEYLVGWDVEDSLAGEFEGEEFFCALIPGEGFEASEAGDAVVDVDNEIAGFEVGEGFDGLDVFERADTSADLVLSEDFMVGDENEVGCG